MAEEFDPFDIENLRLSEETAAELAKARQEHEASKHKGNRPEWLEAKLRHTGRRAAARSRSEMIYLL